MKTFVIVLLGSILFSSQALAEYPEKPIKLVVYTAPGGLIDITARKAAALLETELGAVPVVVENKKGAGGLLALRYALSKPSDGYTVLGITSSFVSKVVGSKQGGQLDQLEYLARMVDDYECLITNKKYGPHSLEEIVAKAKQTPGKQLWVGPAKGGTDHIFAMKVWKAAGIEGRWLPYPSGGQAIAALLGGHGSVYVGNPQDVAGRPDLQVIAVASAERLAEQAETPTFKELGYPQLTGESLWRGFAVKKGTPSAVKEKLTTLLAKVHANKEWKSFVANGGAVPKFDSGSKFEELVKTQINSDSEFQASGTS